MFLQPAKVSRRIIEAVGVINPQPVDLAGADQAKQEGVRSLKYVFAFHGEGGQVVDVKESAIVDLVRAHLPVRQAVALVFEQVVHESKSCLGRPACRRTGPPCGR